MVPDGAAAEVARAGLLGDGAQVDTVVFFDVDGTLLSTKLNRVHRDSFAHAFESVYGFTANIDEIPHQGKTDRGIILEICARHGVDAEAASARMGDAMTAMLDYCRARRSEMVVQALPGVLPLLEMLARRPNVVLGLVTGNLQEIAWSKVTAAGLSGFFSCGGFGSDNASRAELIRVGLRRVAGLFPAAPLADKAALRVYHVGDTLNDLAAAQDAGVRGVGVATGGCGLAELQGCPFEPFAVVADMADLPAMLALFEQPADSAPAA